MITVYARHGDKCYCLSVSPRWAEANDNGALVSCGLTVGTDITEAQLRSLLSRGKAVEIDFDTWNHSGCQSGCVRRGDPACRW